MNYRLFQYALPAAAELEDLNAYLRAQRVAAVTQHLVQTSGGAMLVFVVETVGLSGTAADGNSAPKVDYREQLSAEDFAVFNRLRDARKQWAESEGVPVYTIFTNAQLAAMVRQHVGSIATLGSIEGIGSARVAKYGERLLAVLAASLVAPGVAP